MGRKTKQSKYIRKKDLKWIPDKAFENTDIHNTINKGMYGVGIEPKDNLKLYNFLFSLCEMRILNTQTLGKIFGKIKVNVW